MPYDEYLKWLKGFWEELYRVLVPGGRFALNVAPTSIKDFAQFTMIWLVIDANRFYHAHRDPVVQTTCAAEPHGVLGKVHEILTWCRVGNMSWCSAKGRGALEGDKADADITGEEFIKYSDAFCQFNRKRAAASLFYIACIHHEMDESHPNKRMAAIRRRFRRN